MFKLYYDNFGITLRRFRIEKTTKPAQLNLLPFYTIVYIPSLLVH